MELTPRQVAALGRAAQEIASLPDDDERIARIVRTEHSEHEGVVLPYGAAELRLLNRYRAGPGVGNSTDDLLERLAAGSPARCWEPLACMSPRRSTRSGSEAESHLRTATLTTGVKAVNPASSSEKRTTYRVVREGRSRGLWNLPPLPT